MSASFLYWYFAHKTITDINSQNPNNADLDPAHWASLNMLNE